MAWPCGVSRYLTLGGCRGQAHLARGASQDAGLFRALIFTVCNYLHAVVGR
jgi:hypothetical protein